MEVAVDCRHLIQPVKSITEFYNSEGIAIAPDGTILIGDRNNCMPHFNMVANSLPPQKYIQKIINYFVLY